MPQLQLQLIPQSPSCPDEVAAPHRAHIWGSQALGLGPLGLAWTSSEPSCEAVYCPCPAERVHGPALLVLCLSRKRRLSSRYRRARRYRYRGGAASSGRR